MIAANLAQKSRSETCALTPAMVADDWLFSLSSFVAHSKPAAVSAAVGYGMAVSAGVERWLKSRDSAVVSATARPGQSHPFRQIGVLPQGQQSDGGRSGLVGASIANPPVYENRGLAYQAYGRLYIHRPICNAPSTIRPSKKGVLVEISRRSRYVVPATRKEVVKQFHLGGLITSFVGDLPSKYASAYPAMGVRLDQAALTTRNKSSLMPCQIKLAPYACIVASPIPKVIDFAISENEESRLGIDIDSPSIANPKIETGTAIAQCKHHSLLNSFHRALNRTPENNAGNIVANKRKQAIKIERLRYKGSFAWRRAAKLANNANTNPPMFLAVAKLMVEFPYQCRFLEIAHRSRIAALTARKEVSNKFYLGNSTTLQPQFNPVDADVAVAKLMVSSFGLGCERNDSQPHLMQLVAANGACHGNSLARESATFFKVSAVIRHISYPAVSRGDS